MVAFAHVVRAVSRFLFCHQGVSDLPQHFDCLVMADWHVTYFSNYSVFSPVTETIIVIDEELIVELGTADLSVNEDHLIRFEITDQVQGLKWIEP